MFDILVALNILLKQTEKQRNLTFLYVSLFALLCLMLFMDSRERKRIVDNKLLKKIVIVMLVIAIIAMAILYFMS
ncbi:MAG: hypothetical protein IJD48_04640 [Clostridia bacterium]|nr:hypothetical protein [Clostridia bacterium]